jgi:hypothetical protein
MPVGNLRKRSGLASRGSVGFTVAALPRRTCSTGLISPRRRGLPSSAASAVPVATIQGSRLRGNGGGDSNPDSLSGAPEGPPLFTGYSTERLQLCRPRSRGRVVGGQRAGARTHNGSHRAYHAQGLSAASPSVAYGWTRIPRSTWSPARNRAGPPDGSASLRARRSLECSTSRGATGHCSSCSRSLDCGSARRSA